MGRTFFIDIDGTLVYHKTLVELNKLLSSYNNGVDIEEELLPGVIQFWGDFEDDDKIIITTGRSSKYSEMTKKIFTDNNLRYTSILFDLDSGPRILINDNVNIYTKKAIAINVRRNGGFYFDEEGPMNNNNNNVKLD